MISALAFLLVALSAQSEGPELPLHTGAGLVVQANANVIIYRPLTADGQVGKATTLKIRGTSRVFIFGKERRGEQFVPVQRAVEPTRLERNQYISAIYTIVDSDPVLLTAVVQPRTAK